MAGFDCDTYGCLGQMVIDPGGTDFPLNCPAWDLYGFQQLWTEFAIRGDSVIVPTAPGQRSYPSRLDQGEYEMTMFVNGEVDPDGVPYADLWVGLYTNLQLLWVNALSPIGTGRGTRAAQLTLPGALGTLDADVKFEPLRAASEIVNPRFAEYRTTLTIPAGRFE